MDSIWRYSSKTKFLSARKVFVLATFLLCVKLSIADTQLVRTLAEFNSVLHDGEQGEWIKERWQTFMSEDKCKSGESITFNSDGTAVREYCSISGKVESEEISWTVSKNNVPDFLFVLGEDAYLARIRKIDGLFEMRLQNDSGIKS